MCVCVCVCFKQQQKSRGGPYVLTLPMSLVLTVLGLVFLLLPTIDTDSHQVKQKEGTNWKNIVRLGDQKEELNNHVWGRAGTRGPWEISVAGTHGLIL